MTYVLGIDIGTSYTAAAVLRLDADAGAMPQSLRLGSRRDAVPSVVFLPEDGPLLVGEAAERRGMSEPDRLVRDFKRRMGDDVPIVVGEGTVRPEDLIATMARWVVEQASEREGGAPAGLAVSHPAGWGPYKVQLLRDALERAGLPDAILLTEPAAAARHYAAQERVAAGTTIAVYDLGGGTFDAAILRKEESGRFTLLGRPEGLEGIGGRDFDDAVVRHVTTALGDRLAELDPDDPEMALALARLRRECVEAKETLSYDSEATIPVLLPGLTTQVRLLRTEFESLIEEPVEETIAALVAATEAAGLGVQALSTVLLVGGSSRIPLIAELISAELGRPVAVDVDPKAAICSGAAAVAAVPVRPALVPVAAPEPGLDARVFSPHPPRFGAGVAAFGGTSVTGRSVRVRIIAGVAAGAAGIFALAGPASPTAVGTDPFSSDVASATEGDTGAAAAAASDTTEELPGESPAAEPVDTTPELFDTPAPGVRSQPISSWGRATNNGSTPSRATSSPGTASGSGTAAPSTGPLKPGATQGPTGPVTTPGPTTSPDGTPTPTPPPTTTPTPTPTTTPEPTPTTTPEPTPTTTPEPTPTTNPEPTPTTTPTTPPEQQPEQPIEEQPVENPPVEEPAPPVEEQPAETPAEQPVALV
ncbi:Hsp70 family protein [Naasia sp. SYSU D00057]|uniref:Hsp70 family protein n=1 Tax=Naasia sp. SYSU D00057 TaxID=2817380 RepID=UPI001B30235E|nr:Hsp70 family protein [Naasia sp. SYSU D00057]